MKRKLIVFEGVDYCGKTTQIENAVLFLRRKGKDVVQYREPGGTDTGERIRKLLLDKEQVEMRAKTELLLFFASRVQLLEEKVLPALNAGMNVILDRYYYSTAAYQGPFMPSYGPTWVLSFAQEWLRLQEPDLVIYLDGDPEKLAPRKTGEKDRFEIRGVEFQKKVRAAYLAMADHHSEIFRVVNSERPIDEVKREIEGILEKEVA